MNWIELKVSCEEEMRDILLAELSQFPFDTFEETDTGLSAFCEESSWNAEAVKEILGRYNQSDYSVTSIEKTNWNEEWEKNYDPIEISENCRVRATFHPASDAEYEIVINPKMSFGTGHHSTTHLVLAYQLTLDHSGKKVLDVGCGTGVLAIMAHKRGARDIQAFDIEDWCVENSIENFALNNCSEIEVKQCELKDVSESDFDMILSNITKGFHLDLMSEYFKKLNQDGLIIMSGFYENDVEEIKALAERIGFRFVESKSRNDWAMLVCQKP